MKFAASRKAFVAGVVLAAVSVLSACTQPPPPPPAAPTFKNRPYPPMGAAPNLAIPQLGVDGTRRTINSGVSGDQALWNLRSAYNVAALNCSRPEHETLVASYGAFLSNHKVSLASANRALDQEFKSIHGSKYIKAREAVQTQVYNYFALPPILPTFCETMLSIGQELLTVPSGQIETYAPTGLARIESVYLQFFDDYDRYRRDFAQWQLDYTAKYGSPPAAGYFLPGETRVQPVAQQPTAGAVATSP